MAARRGFLRPPHGALAAKSVGPAVEVSAPDEQPYAPGEPSPLATGRINGQVRTRAAAVALAKMPRRQAFIPRKLACDPRYEPHNQRRLAWLKARRNEIATATGGVSHGVGAMLAAAAWLHSGGEFAAELAAETGNLDLFKTAASLTSTARQHDLAAWELAVRESEARLERGDTDSDEFDTTDDPYALPASAQDSDTPNHDDAP